MLTRVICAWGIGVDVEKYVLWHDACNRIIFMDSIMLILMITTLIPLLMCYTYNHDNTIYLWNDKTNPNGDSLLFLIGK